ATRMASTELMGSALRVLGALAGFVAPVLLAFDFARIARDESRLLQHTAELRMGEDERARDAVANGRRLRGDTAAADVHREIVLPACIGQLEGLMHDHPRRFATEVVLERPAVDDQLAVAHCHPDARNRAFPLPGRYVCFSTFGHR